MTKLPLKDTVLYRGRVLVDGGPAGTNIRLVNDDGLCNYALRIVEFHVFPTATDGITDFRVNGLLSSSNNLATGLEFNLSDMNQLAWANMGLEDTHEKESPFMLIDPTNLVIRDLYLFLWGDSVDDRYANYFVKCERVILDDNQAVVALANEVSYMT